MSYFSCTMYTYFINQFNIILLNTISHDFDPIPCFNAHDSATVDENMIPIRHEDIQHTCMTGVKINTSLLVRG